MNWVEVGRFLMLTGVVLVVLGLLFSLGDRIPLGRLPGDIRLGNDRIRIYIPVATCIVLSIALTLIVNFFSRR
jgi:hypothetical protein